MCNLRNEKTEGYMTMEDMLHLIMIAYEANTPRLIIVARNRLGKLLGNNEKAAEKILSLAKKQNNQLYKFVKNAIQQ